MFFCFYVLMIVMYSSKFKIFLCFIILGLVFGLLAFVVLPKFKNKDKSQKLALVDLASLDSDGDGLSDKKEQELGTNIYNSDTDGDGYSDLEEVKSGYDPLKIESYNLIDEDGDGLTLEDEKKYNTNPKNPDSDYDGYLDGVEIATGYDPLVTNLAFLKDLAAQENNDKEKPISLSSKVQAVESALSAQTPADLEKNLAEVAVKENGGSASQIDLANFSSDDIKTSELKTKGGANKEIVQAYVNSLGILAFKSLPFSILNEQETQNYLGGLDPNNQRMVDENLKILEDTIVSLKNTDVPNDEEIILWHKDLLSFLLNIKSTTGAWQEGRNDINSLLALLKRSQNMADYGTGELLPGLYKIAEKYNIELPKEDFFQKIPR
jgi:hypothetical protein